MLRLAALIIALPLLALAGDKYHVYKTSNAECEIDQRDHEAMKSQRSGECLGHDESRTDAEKIRVEKVKAGACKCPTGDTCK